MLPNALNTPFFLNDVLIEPLLHRLHRGDQIIHLEPRMMYLLCLLAAEPQVVQARRALMDAVWSDVTVNDESLTKAISDIRKALGDAARQPTYIETIPKVGYRLIASVRSQHTTAQAAPRPAVPRTERSRTRHLWLAIAVLFCMMCGQWFYVAYTTPEATITKQVTKSAPIIVTATVDGEHPAEVAGKVEAVVEAIVEREIERVTTSSE